MSTTKKYDACMVDIETYGLHKYCPIWAISLVYFNYHDYDVKVVTFVPSVRYQKEELGMRVDKGFWNKIDPDGIIRATIRNRLRANADEYHTYVKHDMLQLAQDIRDSIIHNVKQPEQACLYGNDIDFDKGHMEELFDLMNFSYPWHYRAWVSVPTIIKMAELKTGINYKKRFHSEVRDATHNPILDCLDQIRYTKQALTALEII